MSSRIQGYLEILVGHGLAFIASEHRSLTLANVLSQATNGLQQAAVRTGVSKANVEHEVSQSLTCSRSVTAQVVQASAERLLSLSRVALRAL